MVALSLAVRISFFFFAALLIISIFCWIKLFFEINEIKKLDKLNGDIALLGAPFFLTKLLEIKKLATKNRRYLPVFLHFCQTYRSLFIEKGFTFLNVFFRKLANQKNWNDFLAESEFRSNFSKRFFEFQKKVNQFATNLRSFTILEETTLEKINVFNLVLDKVEEDLKVFKIKLKFNFTEPERLIRNLNSDVKNFKKIIYHHNYQNTLQKLIELEEKLTIFVYKIFDWIKLINIVLIVLPKKNKTLITTFSEIQTRGAPDKAVVNILSVYDQNRVQLELLLENFEVEDGKSFTLKLLSEIEDKIFQLKQRSVMKKIFEDSFKFVVDYFETLNKSFLNFEDVSQSFNKRLFYTQFEKIGFQNFSQLINQTRKQVDDLLVQNYDTGQIFFFQTLLWNIKNILLNCLNLTEIRYQMELFFLTEKEKNETIFLTLLNLHSLLNKKNNFALKLLFNKKLDKLTEDFLFLEQRRLKFDLVDKNSDYNLLFDSFQERVFDLKNNLKNIFFLKFIAESLFVKVNKMRFSSEVYHNKILNCEILFLKQQYKNVIEMLLEMLKPDNYF